MKIAILTGGGDVPGLNVVLKSLVQRGHERGWQVLGLRRGWASLVQLCSTEPASVAAHTLALTRENTRTIDRDGGTMLHSSRTLPARVRGKDVPAHLQENGTFVADAVYDLTPQVLQNLAALQVDVLVVVGGDDTLSYAERLAREGVDVLGVPKTMDNDVVGTDYCLGFATCVARTVGYLHQLRTTTASHERLAVVEVMGRNSGASALVPAYLAGVDRCVVAEVPCDPDVLAAKLSADRRQNPSNYAMVVVSEGARLLQGAVLERGSADAYGHRKLGGIGAVLGEALAARTGVGIVRQELGYLVRTGVPDPLDVMVALQFAAMLVAAIAQKKFGLLMALQRGVYTQVPLTALLGPKRQLDLVSCYDAQEYRPKVEAVLGLPMYLG